jgi:hypothetical protein
MTTLILMAVGAVGIMMIFGFEPVMMLPRDLGLSLSDEALGKLGLVLACLAVVSLIAKLRID